MKSATLPKQRMRSNPSLSVIYRKKEKADKLPDLWKLDFKRPFETINNKRVWLHKLGNHNPGVAIFKVGKEIVDIRYANLSVSSQISKCVLRNPKITSVAVVKIPIPAEKNKLKRKQIICEKVMDNYFHLSAQIARISKGQLYKKIMKLIAKDDVRPDKIIQQLDFRPPYIDFHADKKVRTFSRKEYFYVPGVYIIIVDGEVDYVGKAEGLYGRYYFHYTAREGKEDHRPDKKMAKYDHLLGIKDVRGAFVEIPSIVKKKGRFVQLSQKQIAKSALALEKRLDVILKPRHTDLHDEVDTPVLTQEEIDWIRQSKEPAPF